MENIKKRTPRQVPIKEWHARCFADRADAGKLSTTFRKLQVQYKFIYAKSQVI